MKKYEYMTTFVTEIDLIHEPQGGHLSDKLDYLGDKGWELTSTSHIREQPITTESGEHRFVPGYVMIWKKLKGQ